MAELFKLGMAASALRQVQGGWDSVRAFSVTMWLKFAVPAACYCLNNNIHLLVLSAVSPASFMVMLHTRALWAGLLFRCVLARRLSRRQWAALALLCSGAALAQWSTAGNDADNIAAERDGAGVAIAMTPTGLLLACLYAVISSFAGVYNEALLKTAGSYSIHAANVPLYLWGSAFNFALLLVAQRSRGGSNEAHAAGLTRGWEQWPTWATAMLMATSGLANGWVMKRFDNIVKILCIAASNSLVYGVSVIFLGTPLVPGFVVGGGAVLLSAYWYNVSPSDSGDAVSAETVTGSRKLGAAALADRRALTDPSAGPGDRVVPFSTASTSVQMQSV